MLLKEEGFPDQDVVLWVFLIRMWSCGVSCAVLDAFYQVASPGALKRDTAEDPGAVGKRVKSLDFGIFGGKPKGFGADAKIRGGLGEVEPGFDAIVGRAMNRDFVMRTERRHALAGPTVAMAGREPIPVQHSGDQIIVGNENELPDGGDDVG
jgi:hypothetical protein